MKSSHVSGQNRAGGPGGPPSLQAFISRHRLSLPNFGAWMIGNEPNVAPASTWAASRLRVLIARLSPYHFVASSMSHGLLGQLTAAVPDVFADYGFMPPPADAELLRCEGVPALWGTTSQRPWNEFGLLAVSNAIAQELVNLARLFQSCGISDDAAVRLADPNLPLIVLGGANAQSASIAAGCQSSRSLADLVYLGEAERHWPAIVALLRDLLAAGTGKLDAARLAAEQFDCLLLPGHDGGRRIVRAAVADLAGQPSLLRNPIWYDADSAGLGSVAIDAGCPFLCGFCKEAWESKPYRTRPVGDVLADILAAKRWQGLDTINLYSFNLTSHPDASAILDGAMRLVPTVLMKSQRFDLLVRRPESLHQQQMLGKTSFTFGLEGISGRIRNFLGKNISAGMAISALEMILEGAVRQIKIFLMITGHETPADMDEFAAFLDELRTVWDRRRLAGSAPVVLSATPMIAMPHTPLQFHAYPSPETARQIRQRVQALGQQRGFVCRDSISYAEGRAAQLLLMSGPAQLDALQAAARAGAYHRNLPQYVCQALEERLDPGFISWALGEKDGGAPLPWEMTAAAGETAALYERYLRLRAALSAPSPPQEQPPRRSPFLPGKIPAPIPTTELWFNVHVDGRLAGVPGKFFQAALARQLALEFPLAGEAYWRPGRCINLPDAVPAHGVRLFALSFRADAGSPIPIPLPQPLSGYSWRVEAAATELAQPPDGCLLRVPFLPEEMTASERRFSGALSEGRIKHTARRLGARKLFIIHRSYARKLGCAYAAWDRDSNVAELAVMLDADLTSLLKKMGRDDWRVPVHLAPSVKLWWANSLTMRCPTCGSAAWIDAWTGRPVNGTGCPQLCGLMPDPGP